MLRKPNKEQVPFTDSCLCLKPRGKIHGDKDRSSSDTIRGMVVPPEGQWRIQLRYCTVQLYQRYVNADMVALFLSLLQSIE
jgi:hypothetical protein